MKYYVKELPQTPIYVRGQPIKFDLLETSDPVLIQELDKCVVKGIAGVISVTKEKYDEELKKKASGNSSEFNSRPSNRRQELSAFHARRAAEAQGKGSSFQFGEHGTFAAPQRDTTPPNVSGVTGRPMPDPIEVPSPSAFSGIFLKPAPTAKASEVNAAAKK